MPNKITLQPIDNTHTQILRQATLYNVNWQSQHLTLEEMDAIQKVAHYYNQWNEEQDFGFIAYHESEVTGVIWLKFFTPNDAGYGFVMQGTPELSICTFPNHRHQGIGKFLLQAIIDKAKEYSLSSISLSVETDNHIAFNLYKSFGFETKSVNKYDYVMLLTLKKIWKKI